MEREAAAHRGPDRDEERAAGDGDRRGGAGRGRRRRRRRRRRRLESSFLPFRRSSPVPLFRRRLVGGLLPGGPSVLEQALKVRRQAVVPPGARRKRRGWRLVAVVASLPLPDSAPPRRLGHLQQQKGLVFQHRVLLDQSGRQEPPRQLVGDDKGRAEGAEPPSRVRDRRVAGVFVVFVVVVVVVVAVVAGVFLVVIISAAAAAAPRRGSGPALQALGQDPVSLLQRRERPGRPGERALVGVDRRGEGEVAPAQGRGGLEAAFECGAGGGTG